MPDFITVTVGDAQIEKHINPAHIESVTKLERVFGHNGWVERTELIMISGAVYRTDEPRDELLARITERNAE